MGSRRDITIVILPIRGNFAPIVYNSKTIAIFLSGAPIRPEPDRPKVIELKTNESANNAKVSLPG